jgi:hypothetical protein
MAQQHFDRTQAERQFHRAMVSGTDRLKREIGYNPTYFKRMVDADGGLAAANHLLGGRPQDYAVPRVRLAGVDPRLKAG